MLASFTRRVLALRNAHGVFRQERFLDGAPTESALPDAWWFRPDGRPMAQRDWQNGDLRHLGVFLDGSSARSTEEAVDSSFVVLVNGETEESAFRLPPRRFGLEWEAVLDTSTAEIPKTTYPGLILRELFLDAPFSFSVARGRYSRPLHGYSASLPIRRGVTSEDPICSKTPSREFPRSTLKKWLFDGDPLLVQSCV